MRWILLIGIKAYQRLLAPFLGDNCRFYPSCSMYAKEAIEYWGPIRGSVKVVRRLVKCHPWHPGGFDPVVHKGETSL